MRLLIVWCLWLVAYSPYITPLLTWVNAWSNMLLSLAFLSLCSLAGLVAYIYTCVLLVRERILTVGQRVWLLLPALPLICCIFSSLKLDFDTLVNSAFVIFSLPLCLWIGLARRERYRQRVEAGE
jgi:hypothetical protein